MSLLFAKCWFWNLETDLKKRSKSSHFYIVILCSIFIQLHLIEGSHNWWSVFSLCISANQRRPLMVTSEGSRQYRGKVRQEACWCRVCCCFAQSGLLLSQKRFCTDFRRLTFQIGWLFVFIGCLHVCIQLFLCCFEDR